MTYIIIVLVVALVLAPIFWIMPSPRQKRLMAFRQAALELGMLVQVTDLPQTHRARVRKEPPQHGVLYRLPWKHPQLTSQSFALLVLRDEPSESTDKLPSGAVAQLLREHLADYPEQFSAIEFSNIGVAVYWKELGPVEYVETLHKSLAELCKQLGKIDKAQLEGDLDWQ